LPLQKGWFADSFLVVDAILVALALAGAVDDPEAWNRITSPLLAQWHAAQAFPQAIPPLGPLPTEIDDSDDENHGANAPGPLVP
jgi:hypothetical protein